MPNKSKKNSHTLTQTPNFYSLLAGSRAETAKLLSSITGVNIKTARRWISQKHGISAGNRKLIDLATAGHIVPESWRRFFKFTGDHAVIHDSYVFDADQLNLYWLKVQEIEFMKSDIELLKKTIAEYNDYIQYLERLQKRAKVIKLDSSKTRPSLTLNKENNPIFNKPK